MNKKIKYFEWFDKIIVPMLKKHPQFVKCGCTSDETGNRYVCPFHFVEKIIQVEIGNHVSYLDEENARLKRNTDAGFEPELNKLKELERQLTLIRDDFSGYDKFIERNIKQANVIKKWEESFKDLLETLETLDYITNTEKESDGLRQKIINIVKMVRPNSSQH